MAYDGYQSILEEIVIENVTDGTQRVLNLTKKYFKRLISDVDGPYTNSILMDRALLDKSEDRKLTYFFKRDGVCRDYYDDLRNVIDSELLGDTLDHIGYRVRIYDEFSNDLDAVQTYVCGKKFEDKQYRETEIEGLNLEEPWFVGDIGLYINRDEDESEATAKAVEEVFKMCKVIDSKFKLNCKPDIDKEGMEFFINGEIKDIRSFIDDLSKLDSYAAKNNLDYYIGGSMIPLNENDFSYITLESKINERGVIKAYASN